MKAASRPYAQVIRTIRQRIEHGGERVWRFDDFSELPSAALAQALSRLARRGDLQRLSKGIYYRPRRTAFGPSKPNPFDLQKLASRHKTMIPAGIAAAGLLGFTTQNPARNEVATDAGSLPRKLLGEGTIIRSRRPFAWRQLSAEEGALLDFLRNGGKFSELSPEETIKRLSAQLSKDNRFERLLAVADTEPPRVRAILGAIGQQLGKKKTQLEQLRQSLNPLSRFDFGHLDALTHAQEWQAKMKA